MCCTSLESDIELGGDLGMRRTREAEKEGDGERGRWREREAEREGGGEGGRRDACGEEYSIVYTDSDFDSHDHDNQLISLIIQLLYTAHSYLLLQNSLYKWI